MENENASAIGVDRKEVSALLRLCARLLAAKVIANLTADGPEVDAAIAAANQQADAIDAIHKEAHVFILGLSPWTMNPVPLPVKGKTYPTLIVREESGETFGVGFATPFDAIKLGSGMAALAHIFGLVGDETTH